MKKIKPLMIVASLLLSQVSFASDDLHEEGEKLYKTNCAVCHGSTGGMDMNKRLAPTIAAVRMHYIDTYPDQTNFVNAVSSWVEKQDPNKSLMRGAIQKFKIMPPLSVNKDDAQKIAAYIYAGDIEVLEGFKEHVEKEHGKQGKGHGMKHNSMENMQGMGMGMHNQEMHQKMQNMGCMQSGNKGKRGGMKMMMQQLGITPEQQAKMKPLMMQKRSTMMPLREKMHQIKESIEQLDTASPDYKANIFLLAEKKAALVHRMTIEKGEMRMKLDSILNPAQRTQLKELKKAHKGSRGEKHEMINMK
jgi:Spy/CpxP family protein refolding chaperone